MATQAQINANRRNSALSTGPKTIEGKHIVSKNAVRHGLLSKDGLLLGEDRDEYDEFRASCYLEHAPVGFTEGFLVDQIISLSWRIRRAAVIEAGLQVWNQHSRKILDFEWDEKEYRARVANATAQSPSAVEPANAMERAELRRTIQDQTDHNTERGLTARSWDIEMIAKLQGCEARLERRICRLLLFLEARQKQRKKLEQQRRQENVQHPVGAIQLPQESEASEMDPGPTTPTPLLIR